MKTGNASSSERRCPEKSHDEQSLILQLKNLQHVYHRLLMHMPDGCALLSRQPGSGKEEEFFIQEVNPAFEDMTGAAGQELMGRSTLQALPELATRLNRACMQAMGGTQPVDFQHFLSSQAKYFEVRVFAVGENICMGVFSEVTGRMHFQEALRESREKYRTIADFTYDWEYWLSPQGEFLYISPSCKRVTGYTPEEFKYDPDLFRRIIHPDDLPLLNCLKSCDHELQQESHSETDFRIRTRDGREVWISHSCTPVFSETGEYLGRRGSNRDITDRKVAENRLQEFAVEVETQNLELARARNRAQEASKAKSTFLANMSHEIRTPMNAILGFAQVLEQDPDLTPRQAGHLKTITRSGNHLLRLINDILDMSKIEAGQVQSSPEDFGLVDMLEDMGLMFSSRAEAKGLQFILERDRHLPGNIRADQGMLRQIMVNLLGNAVKFTSSGGVACRVRTEPAQDTGEKDDSRLRLTIEVEDSGPGIQEIDQQKLFEPFQQAEEGIKEGGTGLGLAISRSFARLMGGDIEVSSTKDRGSLFRVHILVETSTGPPRTEKKPERIIQGLQPGTGPVRILIVDDRLDNRSLLQAILEPMGFETRQAENGAHCLEIFQDWPPHAVLMDMRMPVMDGYEAVERVRGLPGGRDCFIMAVTASAFEEDRQEILNTGVDAYLRKPFQNVELLEELGKGLHLQYIYACNDAPGENAAGPHACLAAPGLPGHILEDLSLAVSEGDILVLEKIAGKLHRTDPDAADTLLKMIQNYDYRGIESWLKQVEEQNETQYAEDTDDN
ncbi:PAS/PAC sensor hybrid histidine kinase [Desulfonatronospira thiodismutans ASO3-1]|uniref:histidine kinase n=1 Tax=Desulfonatronospira thiodismutans ASO3-1 TaxID=555779 RepID=D6SSG8_9BACT|nr:hybrid sensor histidine kinase/response regulator [Desulfonatronospira thiodismutans]EFI33634.1 PAS/PAC sensor hybrid histidine kinase [Desulfonatronospira thiodismutans ASO3-1]